MYYDHEDLNLIDIYITAYILTYSCRVTRIYILNAYSFVNKSYTKITCDNKMQTAEREGGRKTNRQAEENTEKGISTNRGKA